MGFGSALGSPKTAIPDSETGAFGKAYYLTYKFISRSRPSTATLAVAFWAACILIGRCLWLPWRIFCLLGAIWPAGNARPRSNATYDIFVIGRHYRWSWFYLQGAPLAGRTSTSNIA